ncbi:hypothetical protein CHLRE_13g566626v5 [Chlamydomonas reinhardtii]|uniref:Uncharacterized protein n=1 Tax=Chlamydomonas reinhardtii TaxID=3055 RepID=A0A2K3CZB7_CHLRE|nr:uncharacterized protein CHLRE_13g566626v5 [Chlamydomonas reinhardtii]PNW73633.1 hypothetical protein CHLRE_13g566626v5 [Chlamydomonas reinhardtii]
MARNPTADGWHTGTARRGLHAQVEARCQVGHKSGATTATASGAKRQPRRTSGRRRRRQPKL